MPYFGNPMQLAVLQSIMGQQQQQAEEDPQVTLARLRKYKQQQEMQQQAAAQQAGGAVPASWEAFSGQQATAGGSPLQAAALLPGVAGGGAQPPVPAPEDLAAMEASAVAAKQDKYRRARAEALQGLERTGKWDYSGLGGTAGPGFLHVQAPKAGWDPTSALFPPEIQRQLSPPWQVVPPEVYAQNRRSEVAREAAQLRSKGFKAQREADERQFEAEQNQSLKLGLAQLLKGQDTGYENKVANTQQANPGMTYAQAAEQVGPRPQGAERAMKLLLGDTNDKKSMNALLNEIANPTTPPPPPPSFADKETEAAQDSYIEKLLGQSEPAAIGAGAKGFSAFSPNIGRRPPKEAISRAQAERLIRDLGASESGTTREDKVDAIGRALGKHPELKEYFLKEKASIDKGSSPRSRGIGVLIDELSAKGHL